MTNAPRCEQQKLLQDTGVSNSGDMGLQCRAVFLQARLLINDRLENQRLLQRNHLRSRGYDSGTFIVSTDLQQRLIQVVLHACKTQAGT